MTLTAIISDIHSNTQALEAVLDDAREQGAERYWCLGDIIGYGAQPIECLAIVREISSQTIRGNHEQAVLDGPTGFNPLASAAITWTAAQIKQGAHLMNDGLEYLQSLEERKDLETATLVHGSPSHPLDEYLFREDTLEYLPQRMEERPKIARCLERVEQPLELEVSYFACDDEEGWCRAVSHRYEIEIRRDRDAGTVRSAREGGGFDRRQWPGRRGRFGQRRKPDAEELLKRMDANGDGAISRDEARGPMIERFKLMDADGNGAVSREEMDKHLGRAGNSRDRARPPER